MTRSIAAAPTPKTTTCDGPLHLAHTDWLFHHLSVSGADRDVAAFRTAAAGPGDIPWHLDLDRLEEDWFHRLVAPPVPQQRSLSLDGARILAGQLRAAVARRHELAMAQGKACPLDLHALVPVPDDVLRRGPDDAMSLAWLWAHWGTTRALRQVVEDAATQDRRRPPAGGAAALHLTFWSADWTPWRALTRIAARWPALHFDLRPIYDPP